MLKNVFCILILLVFFLALFAGIAKNEKNSFKEDTKEEIIEKEQAGEAAAEATIEEVHYQKDGVDAYYPRMISGGSEKELQQWNEMIDSDFRKILSIYSFQPFPGPTPSTTAVVPTILTIEDEVKLNSGRFFSVMYKASFNSPYSAHPSQLVYTTNIDKQRSKRLRLPEVININKEFIEDFRKWKAIPYEEGNAELDKAIQDYMESITDEDLTMGFQAADRIGSDNIWGIYSYMTPDRLGISVSAPHYLGDHIEFEQAYSKVLKYIKRSRR